MKSNKTILYLVLILVLVSIVQAGDFRFTQGKGVDAVCPRSTGLFTDNIINGAEEQQFTVNVEGAAAVHIAHSQSRRYRLFFAVIIFHRDVVASGTFLIPG